MIEFSGGTLFMQKINEDPVLLEDNVVGTAEYELSANEEAPMYIHTNSNKEFTFETTCLDMSLFEKLFYNPDQSSNFTLEFDHPIMIQARWHKKRRVCKKWLKRYGMKPDVIKVKMKATVIEYDANNKDFSFETDGKREYVLRLDQKRRGLKIEW